jgi:NAD dependent epimerase/dehydratase family enzyme
VQTGARIIGIEGSLAFSSQRCVPKHFLAQGFEFEFPKIEPALADIVARS